MNKNVLSEMKAMLNGCPLMDGREKMQFDEIAGEQITIADYYKMEGKDNYYCVVLSEYPKNYFFTGAQLTTFIDKFGDDAKKVVLEVGKKIKTKNNNTFTPFRFVKEL